MHEGELSEHSLEAIERFRDKIGCHNDEIPQEERMPSRKVVRWRSPRFEPKIHKRSTDHIRKMLKMDEVFEGQGIVTSDVERAHRSLEQIMDILHASGETALYPVIENPAQT